MDKPAKRISDAEAMRRILAGLQRGMSIADACEQAGIKKHGRFKLMRKKYPDFNHAVTQMRYGKGTATKKEGDDILHQADNEWGVKLKDPRLETFLLTYRESHNMTSAARMAAILPSALEDMLDPTSDTYEAELALAMREEDIRSGWEIEDSLIAQAKSGDAVSQRWWLERTMPKYGQRAKSATEANDAKFNPESFKAAMEMLKEMLKEIRSDPPPDPEPLEQPDAGIN